MGDIFTIGYEGTTPEQFIQALLDNHVSTLLDVREIPLSRKKGFSKNQLRELLESKGIEYRHEKILGSPKPVRDELKITKDFKKFFSAYDKHLLNCNEVLGDISQNISGSVALMCFERDVMTCHRRSVAKTLSKLSGSKVKHLAV